MAKTKTSFRKGQGGRKPGVPNKVTRDLRDWLNAFIQGNVKQIEKDWRLLEPRDRIILFEKLLKYSLPALQATSLTVDFDKLSDEDLDKIINGLKNSQA